jgi:hypothetical protein
MPLHKPSLCQEYTLVLSQSSSVTFYFAVLGMEARALHILKIGFLPLSDNAFS